MSNGDDYGSLPASDRPPRSAPPGLLACPYCGAFALRPVEETRETGGLEETISVCSACGQSIVSPRWTARGARRVVLRLLWKVGPYLLIAAAGWLLGPYLPFLPRRVFGRAGGS